VAIAIKKQNRPSFKGLFKIASAIAVSLPTPISNQEASNSNGGRLSELSKTNKNS
jgi:hypothetical protein